MVLSSMRADDRSQLSTVTSLTKLLSTASALPNFTPSQGHTYLPSTSKNPTPGSSLQTTQTSIEGTPMPPGGTPLPATQDTTASTKTSVASKQASNTDYQGIQMLSESFGLSLRYGNEYMDENPIVGEPGSFKLSKSRDPTLTSSMSTTQSSSQLSKVSTPSKDTSVPPIKTTDLPAPSKKGSKGGEKSPFTPGTKEKKEKRRKSKAAGAGGATTPKASTPKPTTPV